MHSVRAVHVSVMRETLVNLADAAAEAKWPAAEDTPETFALRAVMRDSYAKGWLDHARKEIG